MHHVLIMIAAAGRVELDLSGVEAARAEMVRSGLEVGDPVWLGAEEAVDIPFAGDPTRALASVERMVEGWPIDVAALPAANRRKKLLISDMDSTILQNETLDELAEEAGVGAEVAAITDRSMSGEIDFGEALVERVAMLKGLEVSALDRTALRMNPMPGAATLIATMRAHGAFTALVSGGFRHFTRLAAARVGFDREDANDLEIVDGKLTGRLQGRLLDRRGKRERLQSLAAERGLSLADCAAVGDGANDLDMIQAAGLGVGFHAKPVVADACHARIVHGDLTALLYLQGYRRREFVNG
jgi:phosphoserine phosphatase